MKYIAASLTLLLGVIAASAQQQPLSDSDAAKARTPFPPKGSSVLSSLKGSIAPTLNSWIHQHVPEQNLRPCESFSAEELNDLIANLVRASHPALQEIYAAKCETATGCDKRGMRFDNLGGYEADWEHEHKAVLGALLPLYDSDPPDSNVVKSAVTEILRNGKCYEAVQLFYHHLSEDARSKCYTTMMHQHDDQRSRFAIPLLPENREVLDFLSAVYRNSREEDGSRRHLRRGYYHGEIWSNLTAIERDRYHNEVLSGIEMDIIQEVLEKYNTVSPCEMAHRVLTEPWTVEMGVEAGVPQEVAEKIAEALKNDTFNTNGVADPIPDTVTPGAGYIDCGQASVCLEGGDVQYMVQAVVRSYTITGSGKILNKDMIPLGKDVKFETRTFEGMPGSPSVWGPAKAGGDGTGGLLGPAIVAKPGDKVYIFVQNNLADTSALGPVVPTAQEYWDRIEVIRNVPNGTQRLNFAHNVPYNGPEWTQDSYPLNESKPVPADQMTAAAGEANVPGLLTGGFDVFNIHMHGWEVAPHLFYPPGTSDPEADWVTISPNPTSGQQCMCYKLEISAEQSRGDYLYHTHRHGTTSVLSWSGMFGLSLTGEETVAEAREDPSTAATLTQDLVAIADQEDIELDDQDVNFVVIYDSVWDVGNVTTPEGQPEVFLSDFITGERGNAQLNPFFVNNEYQPTIEARTGALTVFRIACVSSSRICAFQILEGDGMSNTSTIIPFDRVASDGITYLKPVHRLGNGNPLIPDVSASEAYLSLGGGMREVITVQFPRAGNYTIWQRGIAFDDAVEQQLMTVNVVGPNAEAKSIEQYNLASARPHLSEEREVVEYRGMTFATNYDQEVYPFSYYGVGDINGNKTEAYNVTTFNIGARGGACGIWVIRNRDIMLHPFHIHVNPFMVLSASAHFADNPDLRFFIEDYTPPWDTDNGTALKGIWRDTAFVPPYGYLVIKQCYDAGLRPSLGADTETFAGKFVFHCHFLVHEDTGLMSNVILASNATTPSPSLSPTSGSSNTTPAPSPSPTSESSNNDTLAPSLFPTTSGSLSRKLTWLPTIAVAFLSCYM